MTAVLVAAGTIVVVMALLDIAWTTVAAGSGAGPITGRLASSLWRLALALHRRRASHRLLSVAGVALVFTVLAGWLVLTLAGWALIFSSADGAVRTADTRAPADLVERLYFTGYSVLTLGNGEYRPGAGLWQLATVLSTGTGLVLVTLAITYLVPVASAFAERRRVASYIASLGTTPHEIVIRSWNGSGFGSLAQHLVSLTPLVHAARQQHLTYPVLHFLHSQQPESATAPNIANLSQALQLLREGVAPAARPDQTVLGPLDVAIGSFLETLRGVHLTAAPAPLPAPDLSPLEEAGIPVVDRPSYEAAAPASEDRRALLAALVAEDGWPAGARTTDHT